MRVQSGDEVYILEHRIPGVAERAHPYDNRARLELVFRLNYYASHNLKYTLTYCLHTRLTGLVYIYNDAGDRLQVHHSDLARP
jgi:hypothetical protein